MTLNYLHVSAEIEHGGGDLFTIFIDTESSSEMMIHLMGFNKAVKFGTLPTSEPSDINKPFNTSSFNFTAPESMGMSDS